MKIGIDARMYRSSIAGIGRYSQNLIRNLLEIDQDDEFVLFMTSKDKEEFDKLKIVNLLKIKNCKLKIVVVDISHYSIAEQTKLPQIIAREKCDLVHFLNLNHPIYYKGKFIITIHDLTLLFYPETARETNFIKRLAFKKVLKSALKNSVKIIAVSENTKKDITKRFNVSNNKIQVIYEAADDKGLTNVSDKTIENIKARYAISNKPVILYVGQWRPHKNIVGLVEAFGILKKSIDATLVLVGKPDPKHKAVFEAIDASTGSASTSSSLSLGVEDLSEVERVDKLGFSSDIVMPGFVSSDELTAWYKIASVFVFPSFYEGFGLPGLEAMAAGVPVVASDKSSLSEVYADAAIYFDPFNPENIADKIKIVLDNDKLKQELIVKGKTQAAKYSWRKTAHQTLEVYHKVV